MPRHHPQDLRPDRPNEPHMTTTLHRLIFAAMTVAALALPGTTGFAQTGIVAWGRNTYGQCDVPALPTGLTYVDMAADHTSAIALRSDGLVVIWGLPAFLPPALPPGLTYLQVATGSTHRVALRSDGTVVAWGDNTHGQTNVPALAPGLDFVQVVAGGNHTLTRLSDGTLRAWGGNLQGQLNIPALPAGLTYTGVFAGGSNSAAKRSDGSLVVWGDNLSGQLVVPALPPGLTYAHVAVGGGFLVGLRSDGTAVAWGYSSWGATTVPALPIGVRYVEVSAGGDHALARRSDGSLVAWGKNTYGQATVPIPPSVYYRYAKICSGQEFNLALIEQSDPQAYCTAKTNSAGCIPTISFSGFPSLSGTDDFHITASNVLNNKYGTMLWSLSQGAVPFLGGTLCLAAPITRTPGQSAFGTPPPVQDCSGTYTFHLSHSYMLSHLLPPGTKLYAQYWSRDKGFAAPNDIGLTNALSFVICP